jgi:hypothetical protein
VEYLSTDMMPADVLTKPLGGAAHRRHAAVLLGSELLAWPRIAEEVISTGSKISAGGYNVVVVDNNDQGGDGITGNPGKLLQVIRWIEQTAYEL